MPLEAPDHQHWRAAVGYVELGMFQEANDQLENIDPFNRAAPEVLAVRIAVYQGLKKWELMQEIAKRLAEFQPNDIQWMVSLAYATRRAVISFSNVSVAILRPTFQYACGAKTS
jgi:hypothetical protein